MNLEKEYALLSIQFDLVNKENERLEKEIERLRKVIEDMGRENDRLRRDNKVVNDSINKYVVDAEERLVRGEELMRVIRGYNPYQE